MFKPLKQNNTFQKFKTPLPTSKTISFFSPASIQFVNLMATRVNSWITSTLPENLSTPAKNHHQTSSISKVRVITRVRPFLPQEISSRNGNHPLSCISVVERESDPSSDEVTVFLKDQETSRNECYKLDAFYGQEDNNVSKIFEREVRPLIPGIFQGYNATVFAYGATGSGKTYTMQGSDHLPGLIPLAMSSILSMCEYTGSTITISYYEIYLDRCYDLLEPKEKEILIWNDKDEQMHLKGLAQTDVNSITKFYDIFSCALQRRKVAQTALNDVSSRSHAVLSISISTPSHDNADNIINGKLNLIDLAGNEDNKKTCNEGIRLQESAKINQSLFALSNVIYALNNSKPRIPYRESKLTRILQDSLGGTSRALMVACLNPAEYQESVYTVSLAARSRHISNFVSPAQNSSKSKVKVDMEAKLLAWLESKGKTKNAPLTGRTPGSVNSARKLNASPSMNENKAIKNVGVSNSKQRITRVVGKNLFNDREYTNQIREAQDRATGDNIKENVTISVKDESKIEGDEATTNKCPLDTVSSPVEGKIKQPMNPRREVFSPINSNISNRDLVHQDPKTPKQYSISFTEENSSQILGTPLDKFTTHSSILKGSLVQDYIEFLNTASREELLELKGIGQKIAEYIIELRETSPLKSLRDLEKMGLSSKQVHNMFGKAARGVFEKLVENNSSF